ncbi:MAG: cobalamin-dependent protein [Elusimicrobia bacterium]|nr:cobalamin-dependent protein [Elusimicrobiota bacterium]
MKILLISVNTFPAEFAYPLGMSVVAKVLSNAGYEVKQFDFFASGKSYDKFKDTFSNFLPHIITISIRNSMKESIEIAKNFVNIIRLKNPQIKIILGGTGFTVNSDECFNKIDADYGFVGQAEDGFVEFIENIINNKQKEKIFYSKNDNELSGALYDIDLLKFYNKYPWAIGISTKRGCKYRCLYCQYKMFDGRNIKYRNIDSVISDIQFLKKQNIENIAFTDSIFNDDSNNHIKLLDKMLKKELNIKWYAFLRPKLLNDYSLNLMKKTGLCAVNIAIDASTDETLIGMQKDFSWQDVEQTLELLKKYDIYINANVIFGGPNETENTLKEGIQNIKKIEHNVNEFDIKIFLGREQYNPTISTELIEEYLNKSFGKKDWYLPLSKEKK